MDDYLLVDESKINNKYRREYVKLMTYLFSTGGKGEENGYYKNNITDCKKSNGNDPSSDQKDEED